ncbi:hypothetical protein V5799_004435 [Amblyomma americanum]|uniref:Uncharacterized protein n=1 Tax=Amblyomma americanum TaxID=6943 RepID=A0AAQ4D645_AMBAM
MMHELGGLDTPRRLRLFPAIHRPEFLVDAHALVTGHKSYCVVNCVNWFRLAGDLVRHHELRLQAFPAGWERLRGSGQPHLEAHRRNMMHKLGGLDTSPRLRPLPSVHLCRPEFVADAQAMAISSSTTSCDCRRSRKVGKGFVSPASRTWKLITTT